MSRPARKAGKRSTVGTVVLVLGGSIALTSGCSTAPSASDVLKQYLSDWNRQDFAAMYQLLSDGVKSTMSEQAFVSRYQAIDKGLEVTRITADIAGIKDDSTSSDTARLSFSTKWETSITDPIHEQYTVSLRKSASGWTVDWTPSLIFPNLQTGWKVRAQVLPASRGVIMDARGVPLAVNEPAFSVGLVPAKTTSDSASRLAAVLGLRPEQVQEKLRQPWVKPDLFVPVSTLPRSVEASLEKQLLGIKGVLISASGTSARAYPQGRLAAQTIGYTAPVTAEELTNDRRQSGYQATDVIGKEGIEQVLETSLRGKPGGRIWLEDAQGHEQAVIAERSPVAGDTVRLTLDAKVQHALETAMAGTTGAAVVLDNKTGRVLAMASMPTFDPSQLSRGLSPEAWQQLSQAGQGALVNKALAALTPGSVVKPLVAAAALDAHAIAPTTVFPADPPMWQRDASWGSHFVKRVEHPAGTVDLLHALVWSDNVYFAQVGLLLGSDRFTHGLQRMGFDSKLPFILPVQPGQISNGGTPIQSDPMLADSAYGQGQDLVSPLQLSAIYSALYNRGEEQQPYLVDTVADPDGKTVQQGQSKVLLKDAVSPSSISFLQQALRQVVTDSTGTGHGVSGLHGWTVSGKTGTAEQQGGQNGSEWGWFTAYAQPQNGSPWIVTMVLNNVQGHGDSHFTVGRVGQFLQLVGAR